MKASDATTKGERTRRRLLTLAISRFAVAGYRRTSVSEIARDAGLTPAAAYAYFTDKEALFVAAVDADAAGLVEEALAEVPDGPPRDRVLGLIAALVAGLDRHRLARRVLAGLEPEVTARLAELPALAQLRATAAAELRTGQEAGTVRRDVDPDALALGIETIVLAAVMTRLQTAAADPALLDARRDAVAAVLDAALRPPT